MEQFTGVTRVITGGISSFRFVEAAGIATWPPENGLEIDESAIVLHPGYAWQLGEADYNSLEYTERAGNDANGVVMEAELSGFLPDDLLANSRAIRAGFNKKFVVIFRTTQGTSRVFGTPSDPCSFTFSTTTAKLGSRKGIGFSFKKKANQLALYIKDTTISFYINNQGQLVQVGSNDESFTITNLGGLLVAGPNEADYSLNASGFLLKA
jgi:hypothetical protein